MNSEFVRFTSAEQVYGEKSLLKLQIELIEAIKKSKKLKTIRNDNYMLKVILKSKIEAVQESLESLKKLLPKPALQDDEPLALQMPSPVIDKERLTLEEEIEMIKQKLERLGY
jgi:hypothetical protein